MIFATHPLVWIAAGSTIDYLWALGALFGGLLALLRGGFLLAGILMGPAVGVRLASAAVFLAFALLTCPRHWLRIPVAGVITAVLGGQRAGALVLTPLHQTLERELRLEVDLLNLRLASTVLAKEVLATGERIDAADPSAADEFEALTLSLYQELNVERAELLRDFDRTGVAFAP